MKTTQAYLMTLIVSVTLMMGFSSFGTATKPDPMQEVEQTITSRRVDPRVELIRSHREVNEKELQWFSTWHESDDLIYDKDGIVVYYNDTHEGADYVWIYDVN